MDDEKGGGSIRPDPRYKRPIRPDHASATADTWTGVPRWRAAGVTRFLGSEFCLVTEDPADEQQRDANPTQVLAFDIIDYGSEPSIVYRLLARGSNKHWGSGWCRRCCGWPVHSTGAGSFAGDRQQIRRPGRRQGKLKLKLDVPAGWRLNK